MPSIHRHQPRVTRTTAVSIGPSKHCMELPFRETVTKTKTKTKTVTKTKTMAPKPTHKSHPTTVVTIGARVRSPHTTEKELWLSVRARSTNSTTTATATTTTSNTSTIATTTTCRQERSTATEELLLLQRFLQSSRYCHFSNKV